VSIVQLSLFIGATGTDDASGMGRVRHGPPHRVARHPVGARVRRARAGVRRQLLDVDHVGAAVARDRLSRLHADAGRALVAVGAVWIDVATALERRVAELRVEAAGRRAEEEEGER
jgi:hypothetical protein